MSDRWITVEADDGSIHVEPIEDDVGHSRSESCICGPTMQFGDDEGVYSVPLIIHHSLDGRENNE
jgi:hypothetical protein